MMNTKINKEVLQEMSMFSREVSKVIEDNLLTVILYGSTTFNDFTKGKGDIDFLVITKDNLSSDNCNRLISFHELLRNGFYGELAVQLEGSYYPNDMISFQKCEGRGLYIGSNRNGWKELEHVKESKISIILYTL